MEDSQLRNLTPGQYLLKAISFDNKGLSTESQLSISVIENKAPSIAFLKPILNERFKETDTIMVELTANDDVKVDSISLSINGSPLRTISNPPYRWMAYSSEDSKLNSLSPGSHMLRVVATDNEGLITKDSLSFEIIKNQSPNIQFISPNNKQVIKQGNNFDIEALVTDDEKVDSVRLYINNITLRTITSPPYIWSSNKDADSILTTLLPGEHLIKILAVDNRGLFTSDSITIQITPNHAPEITLLKPNNTSQFIEGDNIEISAAITDDEQVNYAELYFNNSYNFV